MSLAYSMNYNSLVHNAKLRDSVSLSEPGISYEPILNCMNLKSSVERTRAWRTGQAWPPPEGPCPRACVAWGGRRRLAGSRAAGHSPYTCTRYSSHRQPHATQHHAGWLQKIATCGSLWYEVSSETLWITSKCLIWDQYICRKPSVMLATV